MKEAAQTPPEEPTASKADVVAAFARDTATTRPAPVQGAPGSASPGVDASLEAFFRKRKAGKTDADNTNA